MSKGKKGKEDKQKKQFKVIGLTMLFFIGVFLLVFWFRFGRTTTTDFEKAYTDVLNGKESDTGFLYNGYVFVKISDLWYTKLQKDKTLYKVPFHYNPKEVEDIPILGDSFSFGNNVVNNYSGDLYITFDPTEKELKYIGLANGELSFNIVQTLGLNPKAGCTKNETDGCNGAPIINCGMADLPVILLISSNISRVVVPDQNCMVIQGNEKDLVRAVDKLLYKWYKIM
jgi:hypothetical protein